MKKRDIVVSLDIGTTKIVVAVANRTEDNKLEILGVGTALSNGVNRGVVNNISLTIKSIKSAIDMAEENSGVKIHNVTVGIAGQHIKSRQYSEHITRDIEDSVINDDDINKLLNLVNRLSVEPGEEVIHILPQEYIVDGEETNEPRGMYGTKLGAEFHIVIGNVSSIRNIADCVRKSNLKLSKITLEPLASAEAVLSDEEKEAGVALVDIGGGTTDLAIFKDNIIRHTAVIPFGGKVITEDIKSGCQVIGKQAEKLKIKFGSVLVNKKSNEVVEIPGINGREPKHISLVELSEIIKSRVDEIFKLIKGEINSYNKDNDPRKKLITGVVITGGGSKLKNIKQLVEFELGMECRIGIPNSKVVNSKEENVINIIEDPVYSTSIGLGLLAIKEGSNIEYLEDEEEEKIIDEKEEIILEEKETPKKKKMFSNWMDGITKKLGSIVDDSE